MNRTIPRTIPALTAALFLTCAVGFAPPSLFGSSDKSSKAAPAPKAAAPRPASGAAGAKPGGASTTHTGPTTAGKSGPTTGGKSGPTTTGKPGAGGGAAGTRSGGVVTNKTATGGALPRGAQTTPTRNGAVTRRADGSLSDLHDSKRGMDVHRGSNGERRVSVERADHSRLVAERGRRGYIEHRYGFRGHDYGRRAYYWHGHEYNRYYRGYYYRGVYMGVYAPGFYYGPAFYGWAYNPWYAPVAYGWGWGVATPWYGFYGGYFAPYPVYAAPNLWLTDYIISTDLAAAYEAQRAANAQAAGVPMAAGGQPMLTPDVKAQIAEEVKAQIALENSEATANAQGQEPDPNSSSINRMFSDGKAHVFVAGSALDVVDASGNECALSDGDALQLSAPPAPDTTDAMLVVLASKGGRECPRSTTVRIAVADLQEMQNHMRETIDQGLQELQAKQGTGGLPAAPPSAQAPPVQTAFAQAAPPPPPNGEADVNQQLTAADQAEQEANQPASPIGAVTPAAALTPMASTPAPGAAPAATINIAVGQSIDQVTAALGAPVAIVDLGPKKIYKYKDMKVTFRAGKVSAVE